MVKEYDDEFAQIQEERSTKLRVLITKALDRGIIVHFLVRSPAESRIAENYFEMSFPQYSKELKRVTSFVHMIPETEFAIYFKDVI